MFQLTLAGVKFTEELLALEDCRCHYSGTDCWRSHGLVSFLIEILDFLTMALSPLQHPPKQLRIYNGNAQATSPVSRSTCQSNAKRALNFLGSICRSESDTSELRVDRLREHLGPSKMDIDMTDQGF